MTEARVPVPAPPEAPDLWVVIAAYNEAEVIGATVTEVLGTFPHVVVVDDGSRDATRAAARKAGAEVLRHPINLGQGAALQTGITYALSRGARYLVTFDADGQHDLADVPVMLEALKREGADVVLGSRFLGRTTGMPLRRRLLLKAAVIFTNFTAGVRVTDTHNGLRLLTAAAAAQLKITQNGMAHASEILEQIGRRRLEYVEVPVHIRYTEYSLRKGQRLSGAVRIVSDLFTGWLTRW